MGEKRLRDAEGMTPKGPLCKHFLQTIWMCSEVWRDTLLTSLLQRLLVLENTTLRRIPRLDRWQNANHEQRKNRACAFHLSQEVESATVVEFSLIKQWRPWTPSPPLDTRYSHTTNIGCASLLNESQLRRSTSVSPHVRKISRESFSITLLSNTSLRPKVNYKNIFGIDFPVLLDSTNCEWESRQ